jgi:hypothetical protein
MSMMETRTPGLGSSVRWGVLNVCGSGKRIKDTAIDVFII